MKRVILYIWSIIICIGCTDRLGYESIGECISTNEPKEYFIYTTSDNQKIDVGTNFDATIINHIYQDGVGIIQFDKPVTSIGHGAFLFRSSLTSITIPNSVTSIGSSAFDGCTSLTSITIPDSVTSIECSTFHDCISLASITIPNSVTKIEAKAFQDCTSLTSITIPDSVTSIGLVAFTGCTSLKAFYGKFASADNRYLIIDGVLNSFAPAGLTEYDIPRSVTRIESHAFASCISLTSITIPDTVTSIGKFAFYECSSLTSVYCKPTTPPAGNSYMFTYYYDSEYKPIGCKIYVPRNSVEAYKSAEYWKDYADSIEGYDF